MVREIFKRTDKVILKGALANILLIESAGLEYDRMTKDIDLNSKMNIEELASIIKESVDETFKSNCSVGYKDNGNSYTLKVKIKGDNLGFSVDINRSKELDVFKIVKFIDTEIKTQRIEDTIIDKLLVVSSSKVMRRVKDISDLYYLLHVVEDMTSLKLKRLIEKRNEDLGDFSDLQSYKNEGRDSLLHAYDKFKVFEGKPDLEDSVNLILKFSSYRNKTKNLMWDKERLEWIKK